MTEKSVIKRVAIAPGIRAEFIPRPVDRVAKQLVSIESIMRRVSALDPSNGKIREYRKQLVGLTRAVGERGLDQLDPEVRAQIDKMFNRG